MGVCVFVFLVPFIEGWIFWISFLHGAKAYAPVHASERYTNWDDVADARDTRHGRKDKEKANAFWDEPGVSLLLYNPIGNKLKIQLRVDFQQCCIGGQV